jgi:hypothetical protein
MRFWKALVAVFGVGLLGVLFWSQQAGVNAGSQRITLSSSPFPLAVGSSMLLVSVTDGQGMPLEDVRVFVDGVFNHPGMIPMTGRGQAQRPDGLYPVSMRWSMTGDWVIEVTAILPNNEALKEQFEVFVFPVPPQNGGSITQYRSVSENTITLNANATREKWMIIPMGTQAVLRQGHGEDSEDILLTLGGQDTLVIRNDDIADHTIGPFFIRSGETVRQRFTEPAVFKGECSVSDNGSINIIVEG